MNNPSIDKTYQYDDDITTESSCLSQNPKIFDTFPENIDSSNIEIKEKLNYTLIWNILLLAISWACTLTTSTLFITMAPLSAKSLDARYSITSFCLSFGTAISSIPSYYLFETYGRFITFSIGCFCQMIGASICCLGLYFNILYIVYIGIFIIGLGQGLGQFYRYSAIEICINEKYKNLAVTYVLSGGILASCFGPVIASYASTFSIYQEFLGCYLMIGCLGFFNQLLLFFISFPEAAAYQETNTTNTTNTIRESYIDYRYGRNSILFNESPHNSFVYTSPNDMKSEDITYEVPKSSLLSILKNPKFLLSCGVGTLAHTSMVMIMLSLTIRMSDLNYSLFNISYVMAVHFITMFSPGFVTGKFINSFGCFYMCLCGTFSSCLGCLIFLLQEHHIINLYIGMAFIGIGWNFSFSSSTVLLTYCYDDQDAVRYQAMNDFVLFTIAGIGGTISGGIYNRFGWNADIYLILSVLGSTLVLFYICQHYLTEMIEKHEQHIYGSNNNNSNGIDELRQSYNNIIKKQKEQEAIVDMLTTVTSNSLQDVLIQENSYRQSQSNRISRNHLISHHISFSISMQRLGNNLSFSHYDANETRMALRSSMIA